MARLIRYINLIFGMCMLLPGMALAQAIQNSATGEMNTVGLDLSMATVTLNRTGTVDLNNSSVIVNLPIVVADGNAFSTITVTLRDSNNLPLAGRAVSLASSRDPLDTVTQPVTRTDINGVTTGEIRSSLTGIANVLATDVADSALLTDQPQVLFTLREVLHLTKTVHPEKATVGDVVTYSVAIQNTITNTVSSVRIADTASPVLSYVPGSARLDGNAIADPLPGAPMIFDIGDVQALVDTNGSGIADRGEGGYRALTYAMIVGAGAQVGSYGNRAVAIDACDSCTISAPASADLEITSDPIFDLGTIIGKVFYDIDGDGWQDYGETGIEGAIVALDSGTYALTDEFGRYHFPAIKPGQRMVKLKLNSIAANARATVSDKKVLSVTQGLMAKANFGVNYNFGAESIGREVEFGISLKTVSRKMPDQIAVSTSDSSVVVDGIPFAFANVDATLLDVDSNNIIHAADDGKIDLLRFVLNDTNPDRIVERWTLKIWRDPESTVKLFTGRGEMPDRLLWDDADEIQLLIKPGYVYFYQLEIEEPNLRATSRRGNFSVDRMTTISSKLSGGAFMVNSAVLTNQAKNLLNETAEIMKSHPHEIVQINGHTDARGSRAHNRKLSDRRAMAAFNYLVKVHGLSPDRFIVNGLGEDQAIASNNSEVGRAMNRRVEFVGEMTERERTLLYRTGTSKPRAVMNGKTVEIDSHGEFKGLFDGSYADKIDLQVIDEFGRRITTAIAMPKLNVIQPSGTEYRSFADGQSWSYENGLVPSSQHYEHRLVGETDIGNVVELDGQKLDADDTGRFESRLTLKPGRNKFVLSARNATGYTRYVTVNVRVKTNNSGMPIVVVEPVPRLALQLPPKGVPMRSDNLAVPGETDPGNSVTINGQPVEIEENGRFFTSLPLSLGMNSIVAIVTDSDGNTEEITRDIEYSGDALFIMALADGKISQISREGNLRAASANEADEVLTEGRVALYLKGTVLGKYLITAAFDSGAGNVDKMFSEIDSIENDRLVTNLDPDTIYPVYGDDSTLVYDAESQGKLYLALQGEQLEAVVGNYALNFTDTELTAYQRTLYGARAAWRSMGETEDKQPDTTAELFVAQVDQVPVRDEIAATGGSLYFLSQNEIIQGSEQVSLLVHDQHTGLLLKRITQQRNVDYNIKYREGRIWFARPISSMVADGTLIGSNLLAGNPVSIQVDYEMPVDRLEASVRGARFRQQFAAGLFNIGGIHVEDDGDSGQYTLDGLDVEVKLPTARIVAEIAKSAGADALIFRSDDGGLQFSPLLTGTANNGSAYKLAAEFDAGAWFGSPGRLLGSAYYKHLDAGFVSNGNVALDDNHQYGAVLSYKFSDLNSFLLRVDDQNQGQSLSSTQTTLNWRHSRDKLILEGEYLDRQTNTPEASGSAVVARAQYDWTNSLTASLEHQQSISGSAQTQSAVGVEYAIADKLLVSGRVVNGENGGAFQGGASWDSPIGRLYVQQQLSGAETSDDTGSTVLGAEAPFGAGGTVYTEYQRDRSGEQRGIRSITGIRRDWSITDGLSLLVSGEQTSLQAPGGGDNELSALIGGMSFDSNGIKFSTRNEWRRQRGPTSLDQFVTFNHGELKMSSGFTLLSEYRKSRSDNMLQPDQSTNFEEMSLGFAVRPIEHDRWNVLFKISSLDNDATPAQIDLRYDDSTADLLSTDWSVQLHRRIEWVGKQAFKKKLTKLEDLSRIETNTSLTIQRLNFDIPWNLSIGTEYRRLYQRESDDTHSGWLGEVMWTSIEHIGLGLGYNFTDFSSDLRFDSDYSEYGWFLRVQGRY